MNRFRAESECARRSAPAWAVGLALGIALALLLLPPAAPRGDAHAAPAYWVDNDLIRVTGEEMREQSGRKLLALFAECKKQGTPEFVITYLDADGAKAGYAQSGKYCPGDGAQVTFLLPLPASGTWRVAYKIIQGTM